MQRKKPRMTKEQKRAMVLWDRRENAVHSFRHLPTQERILFFRKIIRIMTPFERLELMRQLENQDALEHLNRENKAFAHECFSKILSIDPNTPTSKDVSMLESCIEIETEETED
jgi:hypothetical protein